MNKLYIRAIAFVMVMGVSWLHLVFCVQPVLALVDGSVYETPVTVANPVGEALTNYQSLVTLNTATLISGGKLRSDCADLRITDTDKTTSLSFWIESGCNSSETKIWVKIPTLSSGESKNISVQYGGGSSTAMSNGSATFDFFDDFSSFNSATWASTGSNQVTGGNLSVTTGTVYSKS
ncbi:DUF2341 domain-containing protein, partial [Candidatus Woesebacteria bacterium]|nr:DUF2341 domain-containing protein [Candidatus Woesebacteria bacterium]